MNTSLHKMIYIFSRKCLMLVCFFISIISNASGQQTTSKDSALKRIIFKQDSMLFSAFNQQNLAKLASFFSSNLEFYNDGGGMTNFDKTMENFKKMFANNAHATLKRELDVHRFEVYAIPEYGAIEIGKHRFIHTENGKKEIGNQKFVITWVRIENKWLVTRIISLGHH